MTIISAILYSVLYYINFYNIKVDLSIISTNVCYTTNNDNLYNTIQLIYYRNFTSTIII